MQSPQINEMPDAVKDNLKEDKDKFECKSQCSGKSRLSAVSTIRSFFSPKTSNDCLLTTVVLAEKYWVPNPDIRSRSKYFIVI